MTRLGLGKYRIPYNALLQLFELGLLHRGELESGPLPADGVELEFGDQRWRLQRKQTNITLLYYRLTPVGNELAQLLQEPPLEEYLQDLKTVLVQGLQIETMMLTPPAGPEPAPVDPAPDPGARPRAPLFRAPPQHLAKYRPAVAKTVLEMRILLHFAANNCPPG